MCLKFDPLEMGNLMTPAKGDSFCCAITFMFHARKLGAFFGETRNSSQRILEVENSAKKTLLDFKLVVSTPLKNISQNGNLPQKISKTTS